MKPKVFIIGSGIIGLTTAITLLEDGWSVHLLAKDFPPNTTSNKAGAVWYPYNVHPPQKAMEWSKVAYQKWEQLAEVADAGVSMVSFTVMEKGWEEGLPWWHEALPAGAYQKQSAGLPQGWAMAHIIQVPFIDPNYCMPYLMGWAERLGLTKEQVLLTDLEAFHKENPDAMIVNCTGLGAKELANDEDLYAVQGQAIVVERLKEAIYQKADEGATLPTYMFTRKDELILGGTAVPHAIDKKPKKEVITDIQKRCFHLRPELENQKVLRHYVGLRPCRPAIRLEWDEHLPVIHNYGQGGGGYTTSWGCAEEVLALLNKGPIRKNI